MRCLSVLGNQLKPQILKQTSLLLFRQTKTIHDANMEFIITWNIKTNGIITDYNNYYYLRVSRNKRLIQYYLVVNIVVLHTDKSAFGDWLYLKTSLLFLLMVITTISSPCCDSSRQSDDD